MSTKDLLSDSEVLARVVAIFERVSPESRERLFQTLATYLGIGHGQREAAKPVPGRSQEVGGALANFTEDRSLSVKEFLLQKQPMTDVERVACLAYYLTHYQNTPHFKTIDISRLNTEAAQIKFSNPAFAVGNANNSGYLTQAGRGTKQITAMGERFVVALPDRDAARAAMSTLKRRKGSKQKKVATGRGSK